MSEHETGAPVTVLGLGDMGRALAAAFLAGGHPTTVWNRTPAKADELVAAGAVRADTVADAIAAGPLVLVCLLDYASVDDVLGPHASALAGRTLVSLTNGTPDEARAMLAWASGHGVGYLDGGIMATPPMVGRPGAVVLYSGSEAELERHAPVLRRLGEATFVGEDAGLASLYDLALLSGMYGMLSGFAHATAMVRGHGMGLAEFTESLLNPWLTGVGSMLPALAAADGTDFDDGSNPAMQRVAIATIMRAARAEGVDPELEGHLRASLRSLGDGAASGSAARPGG